MENLIDNMLIKRIILNHKNKIKEEKKMRTLSGIAAFMVVALFTLTGIAAAASVEIKSKEGIGKYLTDEKGMTLYLFKKDSPDKSACVGPCVEKWPLFSVQDIKPPADIKSGDFKQITRDDGKKQTTYKGQPLYYFFKDSKAGDVNGQGVNNVWYVVTP
jgi:predicted lipoprotein with Yx(FWY)xxD motif